MRNLRSRTLSARALSYLLVPVLAACVALTVPAEAKTKGASTLPCGGVPYPGRPEPEWKQLPGKVAVYNQPQFQIRPDEEGYFAKTGLLVGPKAIFELRATTDNGTPVRFRFGDRIYTAVKPGRCTSKLWTAIPGGLLVNEPSCVRITSTSGRAVESVLVGLGVPCE